MATMRTRTASLYNSLRPMVAGLLLAMLVAVQTLSLQHHAEHFFNTHKHYGHSCPIHDFCEHLSLSDAVPVPQVPVAAQLVDVPAAVLFSVHEGSAVSAAFPRAPPVAA
ncbi:MAG TPA: hypothetical protein VHP58_03605 [Alphaproteobacteria bacterium]|nr:hypothetical protein [Alphaproteobacteria bacterium]